MDIILKITNHPFAWKIVALLAPWLMIFLGIIMIARLAWTKNLETMLTSLSSSYYLNSITTPFKSLGLKGRFWLACAIGCLLSWPTYAIHIRLNKLDRREVENFPKKLKRQLKSAELLMFAGAVLAFASYLYFKKAM